jgi:phosphoribosylanthranilate isomerase
MIDLDSGQLVKICGLRDEAAARTATLAGADMLGFILAESRRQVRPSLVRDVRDTVRGIAETPPVVVGVMVNPSPEQAVAMIAESKIDAVQLSGDEPPDMLDEIDIPVIKTIHVAAGMAFDDLIPLVDPWFDHPRAAVAVHVDAKVAGMYGGTGERSDWGVAARLAERYPTILAGGLRPGNVSEGISVVRPRGVDVSSGVEIDGAKDHALIEAFIAHARQAFAGLAGESET